MNLGEYLRFPRVVACGGSWMATPERISAGDFIGIENDVREAVGAVKAITSDAA
jgi:2-dehydro-3-deoxyphosphogluconate aldolase/(4S)-4-hydroxy-2-oxoglutarate aldolase